MKYKALLTSIAVFFAFSATASADCTFRWTHYGADQTFNRIEKSIGSKVTTDYCERYNSTHEIVIVTHEYGNNERTLVHVLAGLRPRNSKTYPVKNFSAYKFENGNFVVAKRYEMAADLALDTVMDVMSDLDSYVN